MPELLPYILFESPPIGPIALEALRIAQYEPAYVINDKKLTPEEQLAIIEEVQPSFFLVVGFGAIIKRAVLDTVAGQALNIHPSLLPLYRGPAPVVGALLASASETGVTLMEMDPKMDHGPILAQEKIPLRGNERPQELYEILTKKGVQLFLENIDAYLNESLELLPQLHAEATFTHFIKKEDGLLDFSKPALQLEREIRAYASWPRSWIIWNGKRLLIEQAHVDAGRLVLDTVQPEGGLLMPLEAFLRGQRLTEAEFYIQIGIVDN